MAGCFPGAAQALRHRVSIALRACPPPPFPPQAIQFSKAGTLRLPLLDLTPPWGSPIRPLQAAALSAALEGFGAARAAPARLVGPDTCWVVVLYGRAFCAHHDRGAGLLRLYRMFRWAAGRAGVGGLGGGKQGGRTACCPRSRGVHQRTGTPTHG
jgi:hypothetical protein